MGNPFVHVELQTKDVAKAKEFYSQLFDWRLEDLPMDYTMIHVGEGGIGGGMMACPEPHIPSNWMPYVAVDDIQAATEKARGLGATVLHGPQEVPGMVWFSVIQDPTGAVFAMCQAVGQR